MFQFQYKKEIVVGILLAGLVLVTLPVVSFGGDRDTLYVDKDASGTQNGSKNHPFETIYQAIKKADGKTDIYVAEGTYKENVNLKDDIRLIGAGRDKTTIKAKDDDDAVVTMRERTTIEGVKIKEGKIGILVEENGKIEINDVEVEDNDHEGIFILKAPTNERNKVSIVDSMIKENGRTGIYSQERRLVILDSNSNYNGGDGIILEKSVEAWIDNNNIKKNDKSGVVMTLDKSNIDVRNNNIRENGREGLEIDAYGGNGWISIDHAKIRSNKRFGVARVARNGAPASVFENVSIGVNTSFESNGLGTVSSVIPIQ